jgi:hypothetical protein
MTAEQAAKLGNILISLEKETVNLGATIADDEKNW